MNSRAISPSSFGLRNSSIIRLSCFTISLLTTIGFAQTPATSSESARIVVEAHEAQKPALFYSASVHNDLRVGADQITGEIRLKLRVVQGRPEVLALGLSGAGEVLEVTGNGLRDWAVRQGTGNAAGKRFLDLRPALEEGKPGPNEMELIIRTCVKKPDVPGKVQLLLLTPGDAVGFVSQVRLLPEEGIDLRVTQANGLQPLTTELTPHSEQSFSSTGDAKLEIMLMGRGAVLADAELAGPQLAGKVDETSASVDFRLRAEARVKKPNTRLRLLSGRAALSDKTAGDGWHVELANTGDGPAYDLVLERAGTFAIEIGFSAAIGERGDWKVLDFSMPAGAVVPVVLEGLGDGVTFDPGALVVPGASPQGWRGFLPANGSASLSWKRERKSAEGALFFTSNESTELRVGAGLLRQDSRIAFRILQGKLAAVRIRLEGPGEILGVEGTNVIGWKVAQADKGRMLEVALSRPFTSEGVSASRNTGEAVLTIHSQTALGTFPVQAEPVRFMPEGAVRHSGSVRVANSGAVRLEVADVTGMIQLAPEQFAGSAVEAGARQVFVYRFPSANYSYRVVANQILPEVGVSQVAIYAIGETDRVITADLELDIREAPLRDWSLAIPEDYAVSSVTGGEVADYVAETAAKGGARTLKILFSQPVDGRHLVHLRLEKNQVAAAGEWKLPALAFPGAKSVRGHIGVVSTPGFRILPTGTEKLVEMPLSYFPKQVAGLQQAYRLREAGWSATLKIEALGQSVQADVFHLYSLKEGVVYGSVLINYFVVGAPASEWKIEVPESVGNIDVVGQGVRRDWRRQGNQVIVSLHQPVLGAATLLITFEQPMSARGGVIKPGEVRPLGVQGERGFLQVVSPLQVKYAVKKAEGGLLKMEPLELPAEFRLLTTSPSLAVYQYTARPFELEMNADWYAPAEMAEQVVDFAKLSSQVSQDGQVVTDARFFVKTRGRKALRMVLPEGAKLWEARAGGEVVNARADGGQTLVPLPPRLNPNEPVEVTLRLGQSAKHASSPVLGTPKLFVPTVISEWTLHADSGRLLVPKGGTAELVKPTLTETGFEWLSVRQPKAALLLLCMIALAAVLLRATTGGKLTAGMLIALIVLIAAANLALSALHQRRFNLRNVAYSATVVPAGETVTIQVANVEGWHAMISWWGVFAGVLGAAMLLIALLRSFSGETPGRRLSVLGAVLFSVGLLAQRGGAVLFFAALGAAVLLFLLVPGFRPWFRWARGRFGNNAVSSTAPVTALIVFMLALGALIGSPSSVRAEKASPEATLEQGTKAAESLVQSWKIQEGRLFGDVELHVRGVVGDSFLFLKPPAVLTDFQGDGLRVSKVERDGQSAYYVALERDGAFTASAKFEMPADDLTKGFNLPTGPAAMQRITVELDQPGWEFTSPMAVRVQPLADASGKKSGATLALGPDGAAVINLRPKRRDIAAEATKFFAEISNLYVPGPGVVNGWHRVTIRPSQGQVAELDLDVPKGLTVSEVRGGPVGEWRFDPKERKLHVAVEPRQSEAFRFDVETQLGTEALPVNLVLEPVRVRGAVGEVGMIALAFGGDAQPENVQPAGVSAVNPEDFDGRLIPRFKDGQPAAVVQQVFRYGRTGGSVALKVSPVAPEVRVATKQVFSLGDDRLVVSVDFDVAITRAGLFKLSFVLPEGLEVEALSGPALSHWTEAAEEGRRVITMHLNGRTLGPQSFAMTLTGAAPRAQEEWNVPRLVLREATRQTGEILLVPEQGIRLRATGREKVSQLDPRAEGGTRPGTLAFRLLQENWSLKAGIEVLEPWVTVQALQEVTAREGQTMTRIGIRYRIENAAVKHLRLRLPGLTEEQARTVRATGSAVNDLVKIADAKDVWEIRFQRGVAGETDAQIEFQGQAARDQGMEIIQTPVFEGVRQATLFVAMRGSGRLELEAGELPHGWQRADWSAVSANLQDRGDRSVPVLCFRVAEPERPLAVTVRRHDVADALKLRVTKGDLTTVLSPLGPFLTAAELKLEVVEKSTMRVRLPEHAQLFTTIVNGENASVVREGDEFLFYVAPNSEADRSATVRLVYSVPERQGNGIGLQGPALSVPLENVTWRVVVPPGHKMTGYKGGLRLEEQKTGGLFGVQEYRSMVQSKRLSEGQKATALLQKANTLLQQGQQQEAGEALNRAYNGGALDEASNEDARVQLRNLKTQQAVLGLNTRRQRLYLDNNGGVQRNEQLEQAASRNPFMQGLTNFNPQQVDELLGGNTADENAALKGIAARLVDQQLAAEPAPSAIDVTLPERGEVLTFTRSLQVDGNKPLELKLGLAKADRASTGFLLLLLVAIAASGAVVLGGISKPAARNSNDSRE